MYAGDEFYGDEITSPLYRQNYYGNSTGEPAPTIILECGFCMAEIPFLGDGDEIVTEGRFTLPEYYVATCPRCDAVYGEGDTLDVTDPQPRDDAQGE